ncbi:hypothetical protein G3I15_21680, partial [Streptomyces sp. SID10244]|nr:hypothetical protein [Streptomyces sp. SID10244]
PDTNTSRAALTAATPTAAPPAADDSALTTTRRIVLGLAPGALLLLGAIALLGSGSFLEALRATRS